MAAVVAVGGGGQPCRSPAGELRDRALATKVCAEIIMMMPSGLAEDSVKSLTGACHPVGT